MRHLQKMEENDGSGSSRDRPDQRRTEWKRESVKWKLCAKDW